MEKIVSCLMVIVLLTIGIQMNVPRSEATAMPEHYTIQMLRQTDGRVLRSTLDQMASTKWSGYVAANFGTKQTYTSAQGTWVVPTVTHFSDPRFSVEYSSS